MDLQAKTAAINQALILGALRQHELREMAEAAFERLEVEAIEANETNALLGDKAVQLEKLVLQRTVTLRETIAELEAFSYSIAHNMRAPLRSMAMFADILLQEHGDRLNSEGKHHLGRIVKSAAFMDQLIRDVLNYGQVLRNNLPLTRSMLDSSLPNWSKPIHFSWRRRRWSHTKGLSRWYSVMQLCSCKFLRIS
jgi:signal transduction histidine kinase